MHSILRAVPAALELALLAAGLLLAGIPASAGVPEGFTNSLVTGGLSDPTAMSFLPDGRLLICEQGGRLRMVKGGVLLEQPFATLQTQNLGERGLLGVAPHPQFPAQPYIYVYYTATSPRPHNRVSRLVAEGESAVPGSEEILLELDDLSSATIHNGGAVHFGADGMLYVATGDNATGSNSQSLDNLLGKILRLHENGEIPADNPFIQQARGKNRAIWALGLRNPFTFAVQPGSNRIFINDVGERTWEEVNVGRAGANYGWPAKEGPDSGGGGFTGPLFAYRHGAGDSRGCAIAGAAFYNPPAPRFPARYEGRYFFGDFCNGWIRSLDPASGADELFATGISFLVDIQAGTDGALYYLSRGDGAVYRIDFAASGAPAILRDPEDQQARGGGSATFSVTASGQSPLSYQWLRDDKEIPSAMEAELLIQNVRPADDGARFRVRVSNSLGEALSREAVLRVSDNEPPQPVIELPAPDSLYRAGQRIRFRGRATDPEEGSIAGGKLRWTIEFHHADHAHPVKSGIGGAKGVFKIPRLGETAANVFYRFILTAQDSDGAEASVFVDLLPETVMLTLTADPAGLPLLLDDQPLATPHSVAGVVGMKRKLEAPLEGVVNGTTYRFLQWSDGSRRRKRKLKLPPGGVELAALYKAR